VNARTVRQTLEVVTNTALLVVRLALTLTASRASSFVAQRHQRVHARGPARRQPARHQTGHHQ